jgi:hypothetical protein
MTHSHHAASWDTAKPRVIEDPSQTYCYVSHVNEVEVRNVGEVIDFLEKGQQNRSVLCVCVVVCISHSPRLLRRRWTRTPAAVTASSLFVYVRWCDSWWLSCVRAYTALHCIHVCSSLCDDVSVACRVIDWAYHTLHPCIMIGRMFVLWLVLSIP